MAIYFVQHASTLAKVMYLERHLSPKGSKYVERVYTCLRRIGIKVNKIYHTGKTRAMETARVFAVQIEDGNRFELSGMAPYDYVREFAKALKEVGQCIQDTYPTWKDLFPA